KDRIVAAQEVARELGKGKCLAQSLSGPICGRVGGHIEVQDATPVMGQHQEYVKDLEPDGGHGKEVDRDQLLGMVLQEGAPSLRRRFAAAHHIFADVAIFFFSGVACGLSLLWVGAGGAAAFLGASLVGLGMGAEGELIAYLTSRYFGLRSFGEIYGYLFSALTLSGALGSLLMAMGFDR